jgi:hypothetical protein
MLEFNVISEGNNFETFAEEVSLTDYRQIQVQNLVSEELFDYKTNISKESFMKIGRS